MNRAVIASDSNPDYSFYLPIVSLFWRLLNYRPLVLLVGSADAWMADPRLCLAVERAREVGAELYFLGDFQNVRTSTAAQMARIFGALAPGVELDEYLLISDMDMVPLGSWIDQAGGDGLTVLYANAYSQSEYVHYPMCYVGARAAVWHDVVMGSYDAPTVDLSRLRAALAGALSQAPEDVDGAWNYDERYLGARIAAWRERPDIAYPLDAQERVSAIIHPVTLVDRDFSEGQWRIDRSSWDETMARVRKRGSLDGAADAHLPRPGWTEEWWPRILPLLEMALPERFVRWVCEYREAWCALYR